MIQICPLLYSSWPKRGCVLGRALSSLFSPRNEKKNGRGGKERGKNSSMPSSSIEDLRCLRVDRRHTDRGRSRL